MYNVSGCSRENQIRIPIFFVPTHAKLLSQPVVADSCVRTSTDDATARSVYTTHEREDLLQPRNSRGREARRRIANVAASATLFTLWFLVTSPLSHQSISTATMPPKQAEKKAMVKSTKMTQGEKKKLKNDNKVRLIGEDIYWYVEKESSPAPTYPLSVSTVPNTYTGQGKPWKGCRQEGKERRQARTSVRYNNESAWCRWFIRMTLFGFLAQILT
jgi:hypothetical protein